MPHEIRAIPRYSGAVGREAGRAPGICCRWLKYWTIAKPKPISAVAVRCHDIMVRSTLRRVRTQLKLLSDVVLTSNLPAVVAVYTSTMATALSLRLQLRMFDGGDASPPAARYACRQAANYQIRDEREHQRDDQSLDRIKHLKEDQLVDHVHDQPEYNYPSRLVQSMDKPCPPFARFAQYGPNIWRAACLGVLAPVAECQERGHQWLQHKTELHRRTRPRQLLIPDS